GALQGREQFGLLNGAGFIGTVVAAVLPVIVAYKVGTSLTILVPATVLARLLATLAFVPCVAMSLPLARTGGPARRWIRPLLHYGGWITVTGIVAPIITSLDRVVIAAISGPVAVTVYTIPSNLANKVSALPISVVNALFPRLATQYASQSMTGQAHDLVRGSLAALTAALTPIYVLGVFLMRPFLRHWIGGDLAASAAPVGEVLLLALWVNGLAQVPITALQAQGRPDIPAKFHLAELIPSVLFLGVGLHAAGVVGAAFAWGLRAVIDTLLLAAAARIPTSAWGTALAGFSFVAAALVVTLLAPEWGLPRIVSAGVLTVASCTWAWRVAPLEARTRAQQAGSSVRLMWAAARR
ncbi:MAG TPA: oligosaccharide flippase family protein, partial [Chloroflexota bacterium]